MTKLKELTLHHINLIRKEHENLNKSHKYTKFIQLPEYEAALAYAIADFLVFSCYCCGSVYNINIKIDVDENKKKQDFIIYKVVCSKCGTDLGRIIASSEFVISDIKKLYQFIKNCQIIHKIPIYQGGRVIKSLEDIREEDLDETVSDILKAYYERLLYDPHQAPITYF